LEFFLLIFAHAERSLRSHAEHCVLPRLIHLAEETADSHRRLVSKARLKHAKRGPVAELRRVKLSLRLRNRLHNRRHIGDFSLRAIRIAHEHQFEIELIGIILLNKSEIRSKYSFFFLSKIKSLKIPCKSVTMSK